MIRRNRVNIFVNISLMMIYSLGLGQPGGLAIRGGEIHTISGDVIPEGIVLMGEGKIKAVGKDVAIPRGTKVIDGQGMIVTPGIIDARSYFGLRRTADRRKLMIPSHKAIQEFRLQPQSDWLKTGVTTVYIAFQPVNLLGGFGAVVKLAGDSANAILKEMAGIHCSYGESAVRPMNAPTTRQGRIGRLRKVLVEAKAVLDRRNAAADPDLEALVPCLRGEVPFRVYANTPDDIMTALRVAREFGLKLVIESGAGAYLTADALARDGVPVVVGPSIMGLGGGGQYEMFAHMPENAGLLHEAGVQVALSTNSGWGHSVLLEGVVAKSHGLPEDAALRAVTLNAAEILGVAHRIGSIEPGKDADIVVWRGHPLNTWGESRIVIVDGEIVFERDNE
jgi:imidazolonepropionase-like amidohydrolase